MVLNFIAPFARLSWSPLRLAPRKNYCSVRPRWSSSASAIVDNAIAENNVMMFATSYCTYCVQARYLFSELKVDHTVWELDEREDGDSIRQILLEMTGQRTVPNIFVGGKHIGGCDDTFALHEQGQLLGMINP